VTDDAIEGGADHGAIEIELSLSKRVAVLVESAFSLDALGREDGDIRLCRSEAGFRRLHGSIGLLLRGIGLLEPLRADKVALLEALGALQIGAGEIEIGLSRGDG